MSTLPHYETPSALKDAPKATKAYVGVEKNPALLNRLPLTLVPETFGIPDEDECWPRGLIDILQQGEDRVRLGDFKAARQHFQTAYRLWDEDWEVKINREYGEQLLAYEKQEAEKKKKEMEEKDKEVDELALYRASLRAELNLDTTKK